MEVRQPGTTSWTTTELYRPNQMEGSVGVLECWSVGVLESSLSHLRGVVGLVNKFEGLAGQMAGLWFIYQYQ